MLVALYWTGSKGSGVALVLGLWFFALQRWNKLFPILNKLTAAGVIALIVLLALGLTEIVPSRYFGLSMQVRFEYWKAALGGLPGAPSSRRRCGAGRLRGMGELFPRRRWAGRPKEIRTTNSASLLAELGVLGTACLRPALVFDFETLSGAAAQSGKSRMALGADENGDRPASESSKGLLTRIAGSVRNGNVRDLWCLAANLRRCFFGDASRPR